MRRLGDAVQVRSLAADLVSDARLTTLKDIHATLSRHSSSLFGADRLFSLELTWLEEVDCSLVAIITQQMMDSLPSPERALSIAQSLTLLRELREKRHVLSCEAETLGAFDAAVVMVSNLQLGIPPKTNANSTEFFLKIQAQCAFFLRHEIPASATDPRSYVFGRQAFVAKIVGWEANVAAGEAVSMDSLDAVRAFKYLLTPAEMARVVELQIPLFVFNYICF